MRKLLVLFTLASAFIGVCFNQFAYGQELLLPDRCPDPCEVGGAHVTEDYQRLTIPFRIRNADSGGYLKLDERSPSVQPLVEGDDSYLWVLLPGPNLSRSGGDVSGIINGNNFEKKVYKLINLKNSMALIGGGSRSNKSVDSSGTNLGADQFWLFRKDLSDQNNTKYIIYNPEVKDFREKSIYSTGSTVSIDASISSKSTMPALIQDRGETEVSARPGADFGKAGFTWHFEEAPQPRDLARLTIKSVKAIKVSTGRDDKTDILLKSAQYAVDYGPMVVTAGAGVAAKLAAKRAARKALKTSAKDAAEKGLKDRLTALGKKTVSMADDLAATVKNLFKGKATESAATKLTLKKKLLNGSMYVGAAPFRAMWWVTKKTGKTALTAGKGAVKLGKAAARSAEKTAKAACNPSAPNGLIV